MTIQDLEVLQPIGMRHGAQVADNFGGSRIGHHFEVVRPHVILPLRDDMELDKERLNKRVRITVLDDIQLDRRRCAGREPYLFA